MKKIFCQVLGEKELSVKASEKKNQKTKKKELKEKESKKKESIKLHKTKKLKKDHSKNLVNSFVFVPKKKNIGGKNLKFWENKDTLKIIESELFTTKTLKDHMKPLFSLKRVMGLDIENLLQYLKNSNNLRRRLQRKKENLNSQKYHFRKSLRYRALEITNKYLKMNLIKEDQRFFQTLYGLNYVNDNEENCGLIFDSKFKFFYVLIFKYLEDDSDSGVYQTDSPKEIQENVRMENDQTPLIHPIDQVKNGGRVQNGKHFDEEKSGLKDQEALKKVDGDNIKLPWKIRIRELDFSKNRFRKRKKLLVDPMFLHPSKKVNQNGKGGEETNGEKGCRSFEEDK